MPDQHRAAAIAYPPGCDVDAVLDEALERLRRSGTVRIGGLIQRFGARLPSGKREMYLQDLTSGILVRLDEPRGPGAKSCTLDTDALARASFYLREAIAARPDLLVASRFGTEEASGHGLRAEIAEALCARLAVVVPVRIAGLPAWEAFLGAPARVLEPSAAAIVAWALEQHALT